MDQKENHEERPARQKIEVEEIKQPAFIEAEYRRNMAWNRITGVISTVAFILALGAIVFIAWKSSKKIVA